MRRVRGHRGPILALLTCLAVLLVAACSAPPAPHEVGGEYVVLAEQGLQLQGGVAG